MNYLIGVGIGVAVVLVVWLVWAVVAGGTRNGH